MLICNHEAFFLKDQSKSRNSLLVSQSDSNKDKFQTTNAEGSRNEVCYVTESCRIYSIAWFVI